MRMRWGRGSSKWAKGRRRGVDENPFHTGSKARSEVGLARLGSHHVEAKVWELALWGCSACMGAWFACALRSGVVEMGPGALTGR